MSLTRVSIISYIVSAIAILVMVLTLGEGNLPILGDYKSAFFVLWIIGLSMSVIAGTRDNPDGEFTIPKPVMYPLMVLGSITVPLLILELLNISLPLLSQSKERFIALSLLIIIKWVLVHGYNIKKGINE